MPLERSVKEEILPVQEFEEYDKYKSVDAASHLGQDHAEDLPANAPGAANNILSPVPVIIDKPTAFRLSDEYASLYQPLSRSNAESHIRKLGGEAAVLKLDSVDKITIRTRALFALLINILVSHARGNNINYRHDQARQATALGTYLETISVSDLCTLATMRLHLMASRRERKPPKEEEAVNERTDANRALAERVSKTAKIK